MLRTAVVTFVFLLVQGLIGALLIGRRGRPYRAVPVVVHIVLLLFISGGWFYTVSGLSAAAGNHLGSWISESLMGLGVLLLLAGGVILTAGRKVPAPRGLVLTHQLGTAAAFVGGVACIVCLLAGA